MNSALKTAIYLVLVLAAIFFGFKFYSEYKKAEQVSRDAGSETVEAPPVAETNTVTTNIDTNATVSATNATSTSPAVATNAAASNAAPDNAGVTNAPITNAVAEVPTPSATRIERPKSGSMWGYMGAFLGITVLLGLLVAYDVTQFFGNRTVDFLFNEDLKGVHNPEYEEAEQMWANGKPLDAIQLMRDYLKKNPREQHVALRIAEIYEKDLGNHLAAALEYEQVLQHKLPRERWGWAAIHLCNLYAKMGQHEKCIALLRRIDGEYGETPAAKKARKRLALYESSGSEALGIDMPDDPNAPEPIPSAPPASKAKEEPPPAASNLPPGFRPKK
jgi:TolA-binding protein